MQKNDFFQLELPELENTCLHSRYMISLGYDDFYSQIMSTPAFQRLGDISFLGAIDYLPEYKLIRRKLKTRKNHSLSVAALAKLVAQRRNYSQELTKHLVVAGLVHDIGHPPLSHSVEPFLKAHFGYGHHEMGEIVLEGKVKIGKELNEIISKNLDLVFLKRLIDGKASVIDGGDLFSSKINLDTIDGIIRSNRYLNGKSFSLSVTQVALASFTNEIEKKTVVLDNFWLLKDRVYNLLITSGNGLNADVKSRIGFEQGKLKLSESLLFTTEKSWHQIYPLIFDTIRATSNDKCDISGVLEVVKRKYHINKNETRHSKRYLYTKEKKSVYLN